MRKFIFCATLTLFFIACNSNEPTPKTLIGTWEQIGQDADPVSLVFLDSISMNSYRGQDVTGFSYTINDTKLTFKSFAVYDPPLIPDMSFTFTTGFSIKNEVLTLDSFSLDGINYIVPISLKKK